MRLSHGGRSVITRESLSEYTIRCGDGRCDDKRLTRRLVAEAGIAVPRAGWPPSTTRTTRSSTRWATSWSSRPAVNRARASRSASTVPTNSTRRWRGPASSIPTFSSSSARGRRPAAGRDRRQGGRRRAATARGSHRHRTPHRPRADRGPEPAPRRSYRRRITHPIDDVTEATVTRPAGRSTTCCRKAHVAGASHREPASGRHHPRRHRRGEPGVVRGRGDGRRRHRHPGDGHRPAGSRTSPATDYVFIEANERPGLANHEPQPTAQAFVDFLFPGQSGPAAGVDAGPAASVAATRCWCASRSRRPVARWTPARCACRADRPAGNRRTRNAGWPWRRPARRAC